MANNKNCLVYETLGKVSDMEIVESKSDGVRLHGVFGVCGIKNGNNRIYSKENYGKMVENLQKVITNEGCLGELEHPNTMNINLENVSHKIESIEMNEDGTITGTIRLLDTPKGKIAKAIVEGGCPLFISSRGAGSIDEAGNVTLSTIKTYDLVGTPGFSQAKLNLTESQTLECLNESLAVVFEAEDLLGGDDSDDDKKDDSEEDKSDDSKESKDDDSKEEEKKEEEPKEEKPKEEDNNKDNNNKVTMEDIKNTLDKLSEKITSLEAELHVAQESLKESKNNVINYDAIENWVKESFAPTFEESVKESILDSIDEKINESHAHIAAGVEKWVTNEFAPVVEQFVTEEFAAEVEKWITEEYTPVVEQWVNEEYSATVEQWITEHYSDTIQNWITEEYSGAIQNWINEEYSGTVNQWINEEFGKNLSDKIYENVNMFIESKKEDRLEQIDKMLEAIDSLDNTSALDKIVKEDREATKYAGVYVVEHMPAEYLPSWNGISEAKQQEIIRSSRMYDFTKSGVLESFWANVDFNEKAISENQNENKNTQTSFYESIASRMMQLRRM